MNYEQNYEEIVRRFADPKGEFFLQFKNTMKKYRPTLTEDGITEIYHDSFIAAQKNLMEGRVKENTSWNSYLIAIGLNLASHEFRRYGKYDSLDGGGSPESSDDDYYPIDYKPASADVSNEEVAVYNTPEVQLIFGECLSFMNDKCKKILDKTLYGRLSSEEIAVQMDSTPRSIITQRNRCKKNLVELVKARLRDHGYEINENE